MNTLTEHRKQMQYLGENYITKQLVTLGHRILESNLRHPPYEFDIVSSCKADTYVTEVRTVNHKTRDYNLILGKMKLLKLIKGTYRFYPNSILQIAIVKVDKKKVVSSRIYPISIFL